MSRQVDLTKELSEDDVAYLKSRGRDYQLRINEMNLRGGSEPAPTGSQPSDGEPSGSGSTPVDPEQPHGDVTEEQHHWVMSLTVDELKDELEKDGQSTGGKKADLQARLLKVLAAQN